MEYKPTITAGGSFSLLPIGGATASVGSRDQSVAAYARETTEPTHPHDLVEQHVPAYEIPFVFVVEVLLVVAGVKVRGFRIRSLGG